MLSQLMLQLQRLRVAIAILVGFRLQILSGVIHLILGTSCFYFCDESVFNIFLWVNEVIHF